MNVGEPKKSFILKYKGEVIQQDTFREDEYKMFYSLVLSYDPETMSLLNIFDEKRKEKLNKDK